ncbi:hypothetical protein ACFX13_036432 [Malus domestica]
MAQEGKEDSELIDYVPQNALSDSMQDVSMYKPMLYSLQAPLPLPIHWLEALVIDLTHLLEAPLHFHSLTLMILIVGTLAYPQGAFPS